MYLLIVVVETPNCSAISAIVYPDEAMFLILLTLAELNEAKAKNPKRIIFDESKNEYRTLQVLRG